jgi:hypothetical protein
MTLVTMTLVTMTLVTMTLVTMTLVTMTLVTKTLVTMTLVTMNVMAMNVVTHPTSWRCGLQFGRPRLAGRLCGQLIEQLTVGVAVMQMTAPAVRNYGLPYADHGGSGY